MKLLLTLLATCGTIGSLIVNWWLLIGYSYQLVLSTISMYTIQFPLVVSFPPSVFRSPYLFFFCFDYFLTKKKRTKTNISLILFADKKPKLSFLFCFVHLRDLQITIVKIYRVRQLFSILYPLTNGSHQPLTRLFWTKILFFMSEREFLLLSASLTPDSLLVSVTLLQ